MTPKTHTQTWITNYHWWLVRNHLCSVTKLCLALCHPLTVARQALPWDSPGKNFGVSCHPLLQGIFPTQGSNPGLLHCR